MNPPRRTEAVWKQAASWYARMEEPASPAEVAAFEQWLAEDVAHAKAYAEMGPLARAAGRVAAQAVNDEPARSPILRPALAFALVAALFASVVLLWPGWSAPAYAAIGNEGPAVRSVRLADGTRVWLDAGAAIGVRMDAQARIIRIDKGRVRIAPAAGEPTLAVTAADYELAPAGHRVDVTVAPGGITVAALDGAVELASDAGRAAPARIARGRALSINGAATNDASLDPSWPDARVGFSQAPLARILELANRQPGPELVAASPDIAALRVSGVFDLREPRRLARKLAAALDLRIEERAGRLILRR